MPFPTPIPRSKESGWVGREMEKLQKKQGKAKGKDGKKISSNCFFILDSSFFFFLIFKNAS